MRYPASHRQEIRERLVESSGALAKAAGFESTGVDALMAELGLSGGAFYRHFGSKGELFAALVSHELEKSSAMLGGDEDSPPDHLRRRVRSYLSSAHAAQPGSGCALTTLGPEIARAGPDVRRLAETALRELQQRWAEQLEGDADAAWALLSQCVGALVVARVMESERTRKEVLAANRRVAERLYDL